MAALKTAKKSTSFGLPHKVKVHIVELFIMESVRKDPTIAKTLWGREIKLLNFLLKKYPDEKFWTDLHLGYQLHSFAFFKTERGALEIQQAWDLYSLEKAQGLHNVLDTSIKISKMDQQPVPLPAPRLTPVSWADSQDKTI